MNTGTKVLLGFLGGAIAGSAVGGWVMYCATKKVIEERCEMDIQEVRDYYLEKYEGVKKEECNNEEEKKEERKEEQEQENDIASSGQLHYRSYSGSGREAIAEEDCASPRKKELVHIISEEEYQEYDGLADRYHKLWWYANSDFAPLVDESYDEARIFRDSKDITKPLSIDMFDELEDGQFSDIYILTEPGVGGDDGIVARITLCELDFFETDIPYDSVWADDFTQTHYGELAENRFRVPSNDGHKESTREDYDSYTDYLMDNTGDEEEEY